MRRAAPLALAALAAAAPARAQEDGWLTWDSPAEAYVGTSPYRPDFAVYFERDGSWRNVVWEADNMTVAELGARGCAAARDPVRGTVRGNACPAYLTIDAFTDGGEITVVVKRVDGLGAPGQRLAAE